LIGETKNSYSTDLKDKFSKDKENFAQKIRWVSGKFQKQMESLGIFSGHSRDNDKKNFGARFQNLQY
jgi:hypothetical protein